MGVLKMKKLLLAMTLALLVALSPLAGPSRAVADKPVPVPEIDFLTWTPAKFMHYYETSSYIAEEWRKLGLAVKLNPVIFPNPMVSLWFKEHKFDCVLSVLSGLPYRLEPDFFTNAQFNSAHAAPGNWNVGEWANAEFDRLGAAQVEIYDAGKRREVIYKLQEILYTEQPEGIIAYPINNLGINTTRCELDYVQTPDGIRSIWNLPRITPKDGVDTLKIGRVTDQNTWNPVAAVQSDDFDQLRLVYDRLVQVDPKGGIKLWAAEKLDVIDETNIEITLRQGMTFTDGKPVTAADVKFTYDFMKKWEAVYFKKYLTPIKEVKQLDDYRLRFTLVKPYAPFIMNTLGQVFILPKHIWENVVEEHGLDKPQDFHNVPVVGSGMYRMEYWKEAQEFLLLARKDHFNPPAANLLTIVFGSAELVRSALKKGTIDISFQLIVPAAVTEFKKQPNIQVMPAQSNGYMSVRYQTGRAVFSNRDLRRALAHAIPYQKIIDEILGGDAGTSASSITPVNAYWNNPDLKLKAFDLDQARAILKEAGFRWNDEGRLCWPAK